MIDLNRGRDHITISCLDPMHTELYASRPVFDEGYDEERAIEKGNSLVFGCLRTRWPQLGMDEMTKIRYDEHLFHPYLMNRPGASFIELKITPTDEAPLRIFKQPQGISSLCYVNGEGSLRFSDMRSTCSRRMSLVKNKMNVIIILYTRKIIELSLNFEAYISCQEEDSSLIDWVMCFCGRHTGGVFSSFFDSFPHMSRNDAERVWTIVHTARKAMIFAAGSAE